MMLLPPTGSFLKAEAISLPILRSVQCTLRELPASEQKQVTQRVSMSLPAREDSRMMGGMHMN